MLLLLQAGLEEAFFVGIGGVCLFEGERLLIFFGFSRFSAKSREAALIRRWALIKYDSFQINEDMGTDYYISWKINFLCFIL